MPTSPMPDENAAFHAAGTTTVESPNTDSPTTDDHVKVGSASSTVLVGGRTFRVLVAVGAALATFLIIGLPTDIVPNPIFGRDVPVRPWELPVLAATALLTGLYFGLQRPGAEKSAPAIGGAGLAMFAVACPVCNKIILLVLGTSGALGFWQPLQPFLAAVSLFALLAAVIWAWRRNPCADDGYNAEGCSPRSL